MSEVFTHLTREPPWNAAANRRQAIGGQSVPMHTSKSGAEYASFADALIMGILALSARVVALMEIDGEQRHNAFLFSRSSIRIAALNPY